MTRPNPLPRTRLLLACLLLSAASSGHAQSAPANVVTPAPAPREGTVGPEQLRDFSLPGTRQTPAPAPAPEPAPAAAVPAPRAAPPAPQPQPAAPAQRSAPRETPAAEPEAEASTPIPPVTAEPGLPEPTAPAAPEPPLPSTPPPLPPATDGGSSQAAPWWPWLLLAALLGCALALVLRKRRAGGEADDGADEEQPVTAQAEAAPAQAPAAAPAPPLPSGLVTTRLRTGPPLAPRQAPAEPPRPVGGIVSTGLRPRVDLDVAVEELQLTDRELVIRFRLTVANSGSAAARAIAVEALALNAGEDQTARIADFFARPDATEVGIAELPRLGVSELVHEVRMARSQVREYEMEGRRLFVPLLAFVASYRWSQGSGRTGAAFLIGHERPGSDRLAPLRLDGDTASLRGLGVRRLDEQLRT